MAGRTAGVSAAQAPANGLPIMVTKDFPDSPWLSGFVGLCKDVLEPRDRPSRETACGQIWLLLDSAIAEYLRFHTSRLGRVSREDLEDIAAEKSSDLLRKIESRLWDLSGRSASEICAFLSSTARNGLVDRLRESGRRVDLGARDGSTWEQEAAALGAAGCATSCAMSSPDAADVLVERREFAGALRGCAEELDPRSRRVWFLRVFCEMPSKRIATHPQVRLEVSHVDVLLHRMRRRIRECMRRKGYEPADMPPGTFVELWRICGFDEAQGLTGAET